MQKDFVESLLANPELLELDRLIGSIKKIMRNSSQIE
jgi:hypothetical protein